MIWTHKLSGQSIDFVSYCLFSVSTFVSLFIYTYRYYLLSIVLIDTILLSIVLFDMVLIV